MEINNEHFEEISLVFPDARVFSEGGLQYIHLPRLPIPSGGEVEALLLLNGAAPYTTRLFLSTAQTKGPNWTEHHILGKTWWTWSWKDVPSNIRYMEMLSNHIEALR